MTHNNIQSDCKDIFLSYSINLLFSYSDRIAIIAVISIRVFLDDVEPVPHITRNSYIENNWGGENNLFDVRVLFERSVCTSTYRSLVTASPTSLRFPCAFASSRFYRTFLQNSISRAVYTHTHTHTYLVFSRATATTQNAFHNHNTRKSTKTFILRDRWTRDPGKRSVATITECGTSDRSINLSVCLSRTAALGNA